MGSVTYMVGKLWGKGRNRHLYVGGTQFLWNLKLPTALFNEHSHISHIKTCNQTCLSAGNPVHTLWYILKHDNACSFACLFILQLHLREGEYLSWYPKCSMLWELINCHSTSLLTWSWHGCAAIHYGRSHGSILIEWNIIFSWQFDLQLNMTCL